MSPGSRRLTSVFALASLLAAACQDLPTAPVAAPAGSALSSRGAQPLAGGASPHGCFTSIATPDGPHAYRYRRLDLNFAAEALSPDGAVTHYRFRAHAADGSIQRLASCAIPATGAAVQVMNRRFGVQGDQKSRRHPAAGAEEGGIECYVGEDDGNRCSSFGTGAYVWEPSGTTTEPFEPYEPYEPYEPGVAPEPDGGSTALPGDTDGDGDSWDDGPGQFIFCVGVTGGFAALLTVGPAYVSMERMTDALQNQQDAYNARYPRYPLSPPPVEQHAYLDGVLAETSETLRLQRIETASALMTSVAAFGVAVKACAPRLLYPGWW